MRRIVLFLAATLAAPVSFHGAADARPSSSSGGLHESGGTFDRDTLLQVATGVNLVASSVVVYELASGKKALAATGLTMLVVAPTVAYTVNEIRRNPDDALL